MTKFRKISMKKITGAAYFIIESFLGDNEMDTQVICEEITGCPTFD